MISRVHFGMISSVTPPALLPKRVASVAAVWAGPVDPSDHPALADVPLPESLQQAPGRRRLEFLAGRWCARRALELAGCETPWAGPIGPEGAPRWPPGFTGSITHTDGFAWAAAGPKACWAALGIDAERIPSAERIAAISRWVLLRDPEQDERDLRPSSLAEPEWFALAFSARETLYKCLQPLTGARLRFREARIIACEEDLRTVRLRLEPRACPSLVSPREFSIRWEVSDGRVYTALALPWGFLET